MLFAQDKRSLKQTKKDYSFGKANEQVVFDNLNGEKFWVNNSDEFGTISKYEPDCFVRHGGIWYPVEIKYTEVELHFVELKANQCEALAEMGGIYLQATPTRLFFIKADKMKEETYIESGYCNKPVYRYTPKDYEWLVWPKNIEFKAKTDFTVEFTMGKKLYK